MFCRDRRSMEGLRVGVVIVEEAVDGGLEVGDG
jgi:hypothetical protein